MKKIAFIGCGNMARCIIAGLIRSGYDSSCITVSNRSPDKRQALVKDFSVRSSLTNTEAAEWAEVVFLAVKPQQLQAICVELLEVLRAGQRVLSIAAGVELSSLQQWLPNLAVMRVMPNVNVATCEGVIALYASETFAVTDRDCVTQLLTVLGSCVWVEHESQLTAMTILSASGVALYCYFSEALQSAAIRLGLSAEVAELAIQQTMKGTAQRVCGEESVTWETLRQQVTSPGGTTAVALQKWDEEGVSERISRAIDCAIDKTMALRFSEGGKT